MRKHSGRVILSTLFNVIRQTSLPFTNVNNKLKGNLGKKTYRSKPDRSDPKNEIPDFLTFFDHGAFQGGG